MANPGQPTIQTGASGPAVKRLQRALRRTPNLGIVVDGVFGAADARVAFASIDERAFRSNGIVRMIRNRASES